MHMVGTLDSREVPAGLPHRLDGMLARMTQWALLGPKPPFPLSHEDLEVPKHTDTLSERSRGREKEAVRWRLYRKETELFSKDHQTVRGQDPIDWEVKCLSISPAPTLLLARGMVRKIRSLVKKVI